MFSGNVLFVTLHQSIYECFVRCSVETNYGTWLDYSRQALKECRAATHTCRQLQSETRLLLFKYGTFELVDVIDRREFAAWLRLVDGDLRAVALDDQQRAYLAKMGIQVDGH